MLLTRLPLMLTHTKKYARVCVRLACVRLIASVHSEPGSNSCLFVLYLAYIKKGVAYTFFYLKKYIYRKLTLYPSGQGDAKQKLKSSKALCFEKLLLHTTLKGKQGNVSFAQQKQLFRVRPNRKLLLNIVLCQFLY